MHPLSIGPIALPNPVLLAPILEGKADVVYGSRFLGGPRGHRVLYFWHSVGNRVLTLISNALTDLNLTDMETCYKAMRREVVLRLDLPRVQHRHPVAPHECPHGRARADSTQQVGVFSGKHAYLFMSRFANEEDSQI